MIGESDNSNFIQNQQMNQRQKDFVTMNVNDLQGSKKGNLTQNNMVFNNFAFGSGFPQANMNINMNQSMPTNMPQMANMNLTAMGGMGYPPNNWMNYTPPSNVISQPFIH